MDNLDLRRARAARNQSLVREVNERIAELARRFANELRPVAFICECLDPACTATLELPLDEYERLRAGGTRFFVLPGHEDAAIEDVVENTSGYLVVEKLGLAGEIAEALNPRRARST